jgi:hypothetical protein
MTAFSAPEIPPTLAFSSTTLIEVPRSVRRAAVRPLVEVIGSPSFLDCAVVAAQNYEESSQNCETSSRSRLVGAMASKYGLGEKKVGSFAQLLAKMDESALSEVQSLSRAPGLAEERIAETLCRYRKLGCRLLAVAPSSIVSSEAHRQLLKSAGLYDEIDDFVGSDAWEQANPFEIMADFGKKDSALTYVTDSFGSWRQAMNNSWVAQAVLVRPSIYRKSATQLIKRTSGGTERAVIIDRLVQPCDMLPPAIQ